MSVEFPQMRAMCRWSGIQDLSSLAGHRQAAAQVSDLVFRQLALSATADLAGITGTASYGGGPGTTAESVTSGVRDAAAARRA